MTATLLDLDCHAVLFDLDGTLVDTAPDMVAALHRLQTQMGVATTDYARARTCVSNGSAGLVRIGFPDADADIQTGLQQRFLRTYEQQVCASSTVFPGLNALLETLDAQGRPWGVVTNKPQAMTDAIMITLRLHQRMGCAISGDTLPKRKPDPAPMLLASRILDVEPQHIVYVGDARRDIDAGRAAGMTTVAAAWGYITEDDDPAFWQADTVAASPAELTQLLAKALG